MRLRRLAEEGIGYRIANDLDYWVYKESRGFMDKIDQLETHVQSKHVKSDNSGSSDEVPDEVIVGNNEDEVPDNDIVEVGVVKVGVVKVGVLPEIDS
ncbi:hypothetical protein QYF36_003688 [Acer negundo]|nr:hypothetical protein QYF36_003688 [Acer negundo]